MTIPYSVKYLVLLFYLVTEGGSLEMVGKLLNAGAEPSQVDHYGASVLHYATQLCTDDRPDSIEVLSLLLGSMDQEGLDIQDCDGRTALVWASSVGSSAAVKQLIEAKSDPTIADYDGLAGKN